jgi:hypothetical protein
MEPRACKLENRVADEINVDGTDEIYPNVANPIRELVSCGVEMILDKLVIAEDK